MNIVTFRKRASSRGAPLIAMLDLQTEYLAEGRSLYIAGVSGCLERCAKLLSIARHLRLPVAHFRRIGPGHYFNRSTSYAAWIDEFRPRAHEHVFERQLPSCYDNPSFRRLMESMENASVIYCGLSGEHACLSTAIDSYHRGHSCLFVRDATATVSFGDLDESQAHGVVFDLISLYSEVTTLEALLPLLPAMGERQRRLPPEQ